LLQANDQPVKTLSAADLGIKGLALLGYAHFRKTHSMLTPHTHSGMEFIVMLKGTQQYLVGDCLYTLQGGDIFMTAPGEIHSGGNLPQDVAEIIWFQLEFTDPENFLGIALPNSRYLFEQLRMYNQRIKHVSQKEIQVLVNSFHLLNSDSLSENILGQNYFLSFLLKNICIKKLHSDKELNCSGKLISIKEYIREHLYENPTLEQLADYCGYSSSKFNAWFKESMGVTPHAYILYLKVEQAKEQLRTTDKTITEIAHNLCFNSSDYFSSVFKKYTGMTPTQYRSCI